MQNKYIKVWQPIQFNEKWSKTNTSLFDELAPSWYKKRSQLKKNSKEFDEFLNQLKRQHAIETGIIEKLYDLSEGITQTFIKEGFIESYISHNDTNISPNQLMNYLKHQFEAIDFVFDVVTNNRPINKSFILELHQLVLKGQEYTWAIDSLGREIKVEVLKGKFKMHPNNPKRSDGTIFEYCPPLQVDSEIDKLLEISNGLEAKQIHPIILSAWFHHAFTQIHPFQDGNGRMARLLASLILIKHQLFPLNILRTERKEYIEALEQADKGNPENLVILFCKVQKRNIEKALNIQMSFDTLSVLAQTFKEKVEKMSLQEKLERDKTIEKNWNILSESVYEIIGKIQQELFEVIPKEKTYIQTIASKPENSYYYTKQIIALAQENDYFFNKNRPRKWFRISFHISQFKRYDIIISLHYFGYFDSVIALGSFVEFIDKSRKNQRIEQTIPIHIKPYTISLENEFSENSKENLEVFLKDVLKVGMSIIINELT
ncbi:Fic family protein [Raineya orbicola]|jgi:Fic family protein|uniref:Fic/DOC family n=1 Tax=Raineya orbicola TaxID=2016530 RepID=A0A2N3IH76_9BACT|nr:Fic family protein [Raineya orbicola]PKQ69682.1 Fic/DOC family [Raineya orbicola]